MHPVPTQCPVCGEELRVTRLHCDGCGTAIEGVFALDRLLRLNRDQLAFALTFIKRRGKIKDVEDELGVSYPTVVARLNELIAALGYDVQPDSSDDAASPDRAAQRQEILDQLAAGTLSAGEAAQRLRELQLR
jgi:hypothetical protein